jgi:prepilin-type N-terminal cleavage/methylation domain-containing protein
MIGRDARQSHRCEYPGFTLVEILVVVAIMGVLMTIAVTSIAGARRQSRDVKRVADIRAIQVSLELYSNESDGYPPANNPVVLGSGNYKALCNSGFKSGCAVGEKFHQGLVPPAPQPVDGGCTQAQNEYVYHAANKREYTITFCLGGRINELAPGVHTASPSGMR